MTGPAMAGMRCDCHVHVVGPGGSGMVANRLYTPGTAGLETLEGAAGPLGVGRFVVVQPSFYGTDNTVTLAALRALQGRGRGVAVIDPARTGDAALLPMHEVGVCGLRVNLYSTLAGLDVRKLDRMFGETAAVAARVGWHVEVLAALPLLVEHAGLLAGSPAPVVIDHFGLSQGFAPESREGEALLGLVAREHVWVKLSAPYRVSDDPLAVRENGGWMAALLRVAPGRCVWGSDWPHTPPHELQTGGGIPLPYRALDYGDVLRGFLDSAGDAALAERVLVGNPGRLYGFPG